ncbi:NPAS4 protein, partial [Serilophus lunatus]|nr:NPAS4 protein [Serilophus lunatus]
LGYGRGELLGRSWYRLLHPEDLGHVARQHLRLGQWPCLGALPVPWVPCLGALPVSPPCPLCPHIPCVPSNPLCSLRAEAWCLRQQLAAEAPPGPPEPFGPGLDFPGTGGDLGVGSGLGDDIGANVGLGLGVSVGCGLGADVGHGLGANVDPGLGAGVGPGLGA